MSQARRMNHVDPRSVSSRRAQRMVLLFHSDGGVGAWPFAVEAEVDHPLTFAVEAEVDHPLHAHAHAHGHANDNNDDENSNNSNSNSNSNNNLPRMRESQAQKSRRISQERMQKCVAEATRTFEQGELLLASLRSHDESLTVVNLDGRYILNEETARTGMGRSLDAVAECNEFQVLIAHLCEELPKCSCAVETVALSWNFLEVLRIQVPEGRELLLESIARMPGLRHVHIGKLRKWNDDDYDDDDEELSGAGNTWNTMHLGFLTKFLTFAIQTHREKKNLQQQQQQQEQPSYFPLQSFTVDGDGMLILSSQESCDEFSACIAQCPDLQLLRLDHLRMPLETPKQHLLDPLFSALSNSNTNPTGSSVSVSNSPTIRPRPLKTLRLHVFLRTGAFVTEPLVSPRAVKAFLTASPHLQNLALLNVGFNVHTAAALAETLAPTAPLSRLVLLHNDLFRDTEENKQCLHQIFKAASRTTALQHIQIDRTSSSIQHQETAEIIDMAVKVHMKQSGWANICSVADWNVDNAKNPSSSSPPPSRRHQMVAAVATDHVVTETTCRSQPPGSDERPMAQGQEPHSVVNMDEKLEEIEHLWIEYLHSLTQNTFAVNGYDISTTTLFESISTQPNHIIRKKSKV